ncbi:thiolase family protein, partial [Lacticaseibacillus nasuensis]|uniref:thiolase family protein n=1 Tax=Lacticaseibacillus nasuensis TaxID=944671 RepID=UPI000B09A48A
TPDTDAAKLARLKPAFRHGGTVTAGNSSGINDGAAALVLTSKAHAEATHAEYLAELTGYAEGGIDPAIMGYAPKQVIENLLAKTGSTVADIDLFELNEAFAAQSVAVARDLGIPDAKLNVNGGALALGHPLGASGARILVTLIHALRARGLHRGIAALCVGGGMSVAVAVTIPD